MVAFSKYHGAGNDFVLVDDRGATIHETFDRQRIAEVCHRRFGVGADGMIFLRPNDIADFEMIYYNSDGAPSSMCGNGGRCIVRFAGDLGMIGDSCSFVAVDGLHEATLLTDGVVSLKMADTSAVVPAAVEGCKFVDTGSPHVIRFGQDPLSIDVVTEGRKIRYATDYQAEGVNVNFVRRDDSGLIHIATYERGVEDETLACGTGVTAAALTFADLDGWRPGDRFEYHLVAKGGKLSVVGRVAASGFSDVWLTGPTQAVFTGRLR